MSEWQPIDTHPKTAEPVFVFNPKWEIAPIAKYGELHADDGPFYGWLFEDEFIDLGVSAGELGWNEDIEDGNMPTLWCPVPVPAPPAEISK